MGLFEPRRRKYEVIRLEQNPTEPYRRLSLFLFSYPFLSRSSDRVSCIPNQVKYKSQVLGEEHQITSLQDIIQNSDLASVVFAVIESAHHWSEVF